jgi:uncharacterized protein YegP (UPF0339 family)
MKIEIFARRTLRGTRWFFTIKAANGEPIAQSEAYHNRGDAYDTAQSLRAKLFDAQLIYR